MNPIIRKRRVSALDTLPAPHRDFLEGRGAHPRHVGIFSFRFDGGAERVWATTRARYSPRGCRRIPAGARLPGG